MAVATSNNDQEDALTLAMNIIVPDAPESSSAREDQLRSVYADYAAKEAGNFDRLVLFVYDANAVDCVGLSGFGDVTNVPAEPLTQQGMIGQIEGYGPSGQVIAVMS